MKRAFSSITKGLLERTLDTLPDGILLVDGERRVVYCNDTFVEMWGIPPDVMATGQSRALLGFVLDKLEDPDAFLSEVERLYDSTESSRDEIRLKGERVFARRSAHFQSRDFPAARLWVFTDVSAIKELERDSLTGLATRVKFDEEFGDRLLNAPCDRLTAVALVDIDNFKRYNDTYGHAAGDDVIRAVGAAIRAHLRRDADCAYRIGGEEFLVLCQGGTAEGIERFFESLRAGIEALSIEHPENAPHGCVTVSVGLGVVAKRRDPDAVFDAVDKALYAAKRGGRNRLTVASLDEGAPRP